MREKAHVWLVKEAIDLTKNITSQSELTRLLTTGESDVWLGSFWLPDTVIADRKEGHAYRYTINTKKQSLKNINYADFLKNGRACLNYLKEKDHLNYLILGTPRQGRLPSRCSEIAIRIVELITQWQREKTNVNLKRELIITLFMLAHYIADGHMPLHCDLRDTEKSDSLPVDAHGIIESTWEELVIERKLEELRDSLRLEYLLERDSQNVFDLNIPPTKKAANLVEKEMCLATRISFALAQSHLKKTSDLNLKNLVKITRPIFIDTIQTICYLWITLWEIGILEN